MDVSSVEVPKKSAKQHWYDRRLAAFSSRRSNQQNSKKKKDRLHSYSEVLSTSSDEVAKSRPRGSTSSIVAEASNNRKEGSFQVKGSVEQPKPSSSNTALECLLCLTTQPADDFPTLTMCQHQTCSNCFRQYLKVEISESRVNLTCPACQEKLHPSDIISILQDDSDLLSKWEEFLLRRTLSTDPDCRWCPAPDCGFAVIAYGCASCPRIACQRPGCNTEFCYHCRQEWHHNQTCDSAHLQRTRQLRIRTNSGAYSQGSGDEIKPCPKCGAFIVKMNDGSCNHMTCAVCEAEFCWLCLQEITDLHYLSPSGCTFWGKKPWSRKKKILWQLGLLIGAPLGIALVAGVAVPAIIIGMPVWIGKKVVARMRKHNASKHRKRLAAAAAVTGTVIVSPALAALAVAIGVPVMLLYVYGVVPISLCRTGSAGGVKGQQTSSNVAAMLPASFRLDGGASVTSSKTQDDGNSFHARSSHAVPANPSIGEGSVGGMTMGSLNMSHASNLDKMGRGDQDGASTVAMAGTSITGSISGISGGGFNTVNTNRIELHLKDTDQHSIQTHTSVGSNTTGVTSVQIHIDNVSLHSSTGLPSTSTRSNMIRSYSSKRSAGKGKAKASKSASIHSTSSAKSQEEVAIPTEQSSSSIKEEESTVLTIVDESGDAPLVREMVSDCDSISREETGTCAVEIEQNGKPHIEDVATVSVF